MKLGTLLHLPEMKHDGRRFVIEGFRPGQQAFRYDDFRGKTGTVYVIACNDLHKIGLTRDFDKRLAQLDAASPYFLRKVATRKVPLAGMAYAEAWIHSELADRHIKNEWFNVDEMAAVDLLKQSYYRAKAFDLACEQWHWEDQERCRQPEVRDKLRKDYDEFLKRRTQPLPLREPRNE